jgi:hypothetical protein
MGIQSFVPSSGGGMPGANYIASVQMSTYNRSWTQAGGPGDYVLVSSNLSNGYAYFVGSTTIGVPLGRIINLSSSFTRIDIVAPKDDYIMLYKVATKATTVFNNPFAAFASFPSIIKSSGNFVLPNNALPLVNIVLAGGGGGGGSGSHHHAGGAGGGAAVVKLTAYQAVGTTSVTIGSGPGTGGNRDQGGVTYFGNVYALGGGGGGHQGDGQPGGTGANGGGAGTGNAAGGVGVAQTTGQGPGELFGGGFNGGTSSRGSHHHRGGGGGGVGGAGEHGGNNNGGNGGAGHITDIVTGSNNVMFGAGGAGGGHGGYGSTGYSGYTGYGYGGNSHADNNGGNPDNGTVVVMYYIP